MVFAQVRGSLTVNQLDFNELRVGIGGATSLAVQTNTRPRRMNEEKDMKSRMKEKLMYTGAGAGVVLFAVFGLLPGSFLGGVMGLNVVGMLFGEPAGGILSRIIVAISMLAGVLASGLLFTVGGAVLGWLAGTAIELMHKTSAAEHDNNQTHEV